MRSIEVDKGGFGLFSFFTKESTKEVLIEQRSSSLNQLNFLTELGLSFKVGEEITIHSPLRHNEKGHFVYRVRIYEVTSEKYKGEFIKKLS